MKRLVLFGAAVLMAAAGLRAQPAGARVFRAGAATTNITPPLGSPIVGGWNSPPATNVHDELHSRALVLDDGATRLAIVLCDSVGITRIVFDEAKRMVQEKVGLPPENMLMAATHTHSATNARGGRGITPAPLDEYQKFLAYRIRDAVLMAIYRLEPARIGWGVAFNDRQVFNRRWKMKPGSKHLRNPFGGIDKVRMNPPANDPDLIEPAGPTDPQINFISVQSTTGKPIALLANYSLHYVGGVKGGDISGDYFAVFAERITELLNARNQNPPFVGILSNGTSGNINNINFRPGPDAARRRFDPYEKMRMVADEVATGVFEAYRKVEHRDWVPLAAAQKDLMLGVRVPDAEQVEWAQRTLKDPPKYHQHEQVYAERLLKMKDWPREAPVPLQAFRIGDVGVAAIPAEVFVEIGLEIRKRSPLKQTFTIELANGWFGYLPTAEQHEVGGYETWRGTNLLETTAAPKIVEGIVDLFQKVAAPRN